MKEKSMTVEAYRLPISYWDFTDVTDALLMGMWPKMSKRQSLANFISRIYLQHNKSVQLVRTLLSRLGSLIFSIPVGDTLFPFHP